MRDSMPIEAVAEALDPLAFKAADSKFKGYWQTRRRYAREKALTALTAALRADPVYAERDALRAENERLREMERLLLAWDRELPSDKASEYLESAVALSHPQSDPQP